jgi:type III pantothenate kinase
MQSGVINGMRAEMEGIIREYIGKYPDTIPVLCGGDASFFENRLKPPIFVVPDLVLQGLNRILRHHVNRGKIT